MEAIGDLLEVFVGEDACGVAVAEGEADGVVADEGPVYDGDARELFAGVAAVPAAQDVGLADVFCARGGGAEKLGGEVIFGAVCPANG